MPLLECPALIGVVTVNRLDVLTLTTNCIMVQNSVGRYIEMGSDTDTPQFLSIYSNDNNTTNQLNH